MCELHSGGKFDNNAYKVSGGLHGVGVSVVNFLSEWLRLEIRRDGGVWEQEFRRGVPVAARCTGSASRARPARIVTFKPDPEIFSILEFHHDLLVQRLRELAFLNPGLVDPLLRRAQRPASTSFSLQGRDRGVRRVPQPRQDDAPPQADPAPREQRPKARRSRSRCSGTTATTRTSCRSPTRSTTPTAARTCPGSAPPSRARSTATRQANNLLKNLPEGLTGEDVREGLTAVLSVKIHDPKFSSQTKDKLVSSHGQGLGRVGGEHAASPSTSRRTRRSRGGSSASASRRRGRARRPAGRAS